MAESETTRQSMVSLTLVLPVRVILNVLPVGLLTVNVLAAQAAGPLASNTTARAMV